MRHTAIALMLTGILCSAATAAAQEPPAAPPADWGPMSINLEDVPYPHPVEYLPFTLEGQDVRMAYMDVAPRGPANGRSVVLLHGMNFFGEAWTETIDILRKEGYRVIVPDQIGYGRSSKPILHYSISTHAIEHQAAARPPRHHDDRHRHALDGRHGGEPLRVVRIRTRSAISR